MHQHTRLDQLTQLLSEQAVYATEGARYFRRIHSRTVGTVQISPPLPNKIRQSPERGSGVFASFA